MKRSIKKNICRAVLAGLVISLLPVSVSVQAAQRPFTKEAKGKTVPLSRKRIDWYLQQISNTSHVFDNFSNAIKKGTNKFKKAIDELITQLSGEGKVSAESKKVLDAAAVAGGTVAVVGGTSLVAGVGVAGAGVGSAVILEKIRKVGEKAAEESLDWAREKNTKIFREFAKLLKEGKKVKLKDLGWIGADRMKDYAAYAKADAISKVRKAYGFKSFLDLHILPAILIAAGLPVFMLPFMLISLGVNTAFFSSIAVLVYGGAIGVSSLYVKRLEKEEQRYPGTLTAADLETVKIFKNVSKGPIVRAVLQGKRIKDVRYKIAQNIVKKNKLFVRKAASEKRAIKDIQNYMLAKMRIPGLGKILYPMNLNITWHNYLKYMDIKITWKVINEYNRMKKDLNQDERNQLMKEQIEYMRGLYDNMSKTKRFFKRLTPGYHVLNAKEFALKIKPAYALNQNALNSDMRLVRKLDAKYGSEFANKVQPAIEQYRQEMKKIIEELSVTE